MEEIAAHFQFASLNAVYKHLEALEARGHLRRDANRARSIELPRRADVSGIEFPLLGYIAAGRPIEAVETPESLNIPDDLLPRQGSYYVLRVQGDSMVEEHIADGDYVMVESRQNAADGEKVVALVDGENATLKKIYREGSQVRLQPANENLSPIVVDANRVKVQGVVVGVFRKYR
jgi:repressor LexA